MRLALRQVTVGAGRLARALTPRGWRHFALQVGLLGSFEIVYGLSGLYGRRRNALAIENARDLLAFERRHGIGWEHGLQNWTLSRHLLLDVANRTYFISQFTVSTLFLLWVYARRNRSFPVVRNALLAANYVSVVALFVYPLAPPRAVPGAGFADTLDADAVNLHSNLIQVLNNPNSAMPSLHASYAIVLGATGAVLVRPVWLKIMWALYPFLVTFSIVASANHFVLDVVGGAVALLATPLVNRVADHLGAASRRVQARGLRTEQETA